MQESYVFKVNKLSEINYQRISRENPEAEILLVREDSIHYCLMISNKFLKQFVRLLYQIVYSNMSQSGWGWECINHKALLINSEEIAEVVQNLKNAKQFLENKKKNKIEKKMKIKVTVLNI